MKLILFVVLYFVVACISAGLACIVETYQEAHADALMRHRVINVMVEGTILLLCIAVVPILFVMYLYNVLTDQVP